MAASHTTTRPPPLRMLTTPPASPNSKQTPISAYMHSSGAMTPPETPKRSDSLISTHARASGSFRIASKQGLAKLNNVRDGILEFDAEDGQYVVLKDKKLGSGRFSQVYLAEAIQSTQIMDPLESPPATPLSSQYRQTNAAPAVYAVKLAVDKSSLRALRGEARILTHLCAHPDSREHLVSFHGFDPRENSLVFDALPATLADLIAGQLESSNPASRSAWLGRKLPHMALSLTKGLAWIHSLDVVHADVKPPNILLQPCFPVAAPVSYDLSILETSFTPVFADFTSSFITSDDPKILSFSGGGTYDYMAPEQLKPPFPLPDMKMDVYALAVSLLELITGRSPFADSSGNRYMKMAMIKEGKALSWAMRDSVGEARLNTASRVLLETSSLDVKALLELGLQKEPADRVSAEQWSQLW